MCAKNIDTGTNNIYFQLTSCSSLRLLIPFKMVARNANVHNIQESASSFSGLFSTPSMVGINDQVFETPLTSLTAIQHPVQKKVHQE